MSRGWGEFFGEFAGDGGLVRVLGGLVQGEGRRPGDAKHRRRRAEPAGAARRAAACGRILRFLQILMWGQSSSTGTVLPSVRMTLTRLGRQMACSPSLASQPFLMQTWSGQSLVIKAMR